MLLVLLALAIFDLVLSILLRRRVTPFGKSILVPCDEDPGNAAKRNSILVVIEAGLL